MNTIILTKEYLEDFLNYCRIHRNEHDNSFLYEDEDLRTFIIEDNLTLLFIKNDQLLGVFSVMKKNIQDDIIRVRIFHSVEEGYHLLLKHMNKYLKDLKGYRLFIPETSVAANIFKKLGFEIKSKSHRMSYKHEKSDFYLPSDMSLISLKKENMNDWINIYEKSFNSSVTKESLLDDLQSPYVIPNGMMMLKHHNIVGLIVLSFDDNKVPEIETLAVHPDCRGRGYGKILLQYGVQTILNEHGTPSLSVSDKNSAYHLYLNNGFQVQKTFLYMIYQK